MKNGCASYNTSKPVLSVEVAVAVKVFVVISVVVLAFVVITVVAVVGEYTRPDEIIHTG